MDGLSNQIEFCFVLSDLRHPEPDDVESRNLKVLADIEGMLTISTNGEILFREEGVLLLELGVDLTRWVQDRSNGHVHDFEYVSIDYADGPILRFISDGDRHWHLESPWVESNVKMMFQDAAMLGAIEAFLSQLETVLRNRYSIELKDYTGVTQ
jgi:hypothetical protein